MHKHINGQQNDLVLRTLSNEMLNELCGNILPFWVNHAIDDEKGGYYGGISNDIKIDRFADKGSILHSRILWTFSSSSILLRDARYLEAAEHAYRFLSEYLWDKEFGGVYWMADSLGNVINDRKHAYGMAFAIYGLSEYYRACGDLEALKKAKEIFNILEKHFADNVYGGYIEARGRDYSAISDVRLSEKDRNDIKSMNTHLHILEAYTNLLRVWENETLRASLGELLTTIADHIVDSDHHFRLFFNEDWTRTSQTVSYGHDIEGSWLMCETADVLGDDMLKKRIYDIAVKMAYKVLEQGVDSVYGGVYHEAEPGSLDTDKHWWPQAEAVAGFLNAYAITADVSFLNEASRTWSFIKNHIIDSEHGEWFRRCNRSGCVYPDELKVEPWKCPYHNSRACMEVVKRAAERAG